MSSLNSKAFFTQGGVNGGSKKWQRAIRVTIQPQTSIEFQRQRTYHLRDEQD
jgi:hypothetical protein